MVASENFQKCVVNSFEQKSGTTVCLQCHHGWWKI